MPDARGRLELTWTNKHLRLLADEAGGYTWVEPSDYRVAEVRLLHDVLEVGPTRGERSRAKDNLLIRGDALSGLTSLCELPEFAREYVGKVKLVYLDPPFNTQQAFEHYDDALEHSVWLTMMRDRLLQIRKLLAPEGSVWVHCDDSEQAYLKVMMDEVFGRANFVAVVVWEKAQGSRNDTDLSSAHDYLLVFARDAVHWRKTRNLLPRTETQLARYQNPDNDPRGPWRQGDNGMAKSGNESLRYAITLPSGRAVTPPPGSYWRFSPTTYQKARREKRVWFGQDGDSLPIIKRYLNEVQEGVVARTWWPATEVGSNQEAKRDHLRRLFPDIEPFSTPKPERLMHRIVHLASNPGDIVLDCFAGSGTTAAVAHKMGRRWVTVEWSRDTIETFTLPRLEKVVAGGDPGGVTEQTGWEGGGGFRYLEVGPSMFAEVGGRVWLADWANDRDLAEATAAQLGYEYEPDAPFAGRKGRTRLAVVDGLVNGDVIELLVSALPPDERLVVCGTAIDPEAPERLRELRSGSRTRKIPASILAEYRIAQDVRNVPAAPETAEPVQA
jgi:adenine-specific DNA-methyltransferase